jgi:hypothetical protein
MRTEGPDGIFGPLRRLVVSLPAGMENFNFSTFFSLSQPPFLKYLHFSGNVSPADNH